MNSTQLSLSCSENTATGPPVGVQVRPEALSAALDCGSGLRLRTAALDVTALEIVQHRTQAKLMKKHAQLIS